MFIYFDDFIFIVDIYMMVRCFKMLIHIKAWCFFLCVVFTTISTMNVVSATELSSDPVKSSVMNTSVVKTDVNARIVNGEDSVRDYPWMTRLFKDGDNDGDYHNGCGGTLISSQWVLTAAHCVLDRFDDDGVTPLAISPSLLKVVFGGNIYSSYLSEVDRDSFNIESIIIHPEFTGNNEESYAGVGVERDFDIALLKLATPHYVPGPALITGQQFSALEEGSELTVIGYGRLSGDEEYERPEILQWTNLPYINNASCSFFEEGKLTDNMFCAGFNDINNENYSGGCNGDSGGPIFQQNNGQLTLVGLVSWGRSGCDEYGVFVNLATLRSWILDNIYGYQVVEEGTVSLSGDNIQQDGVISVYHYGVDPETDMNGNSYLDIGELNFANQDINETLIIVDNCSGTLLYSTDSSCSITFSLLDSSTNIGTLMASLSVIEIDPDTTEIAQFKDYCLRLNTQSAGQTDESCLSIEGYKEVVAQSSVKSASSGGSVNLWFLLLVSMSFIVRYSIKRSL